MGTQNSAELHSKGNKAAVHSLNHFALTVPDLVTAVKFYDAFGLDVRMEGDRALLRVFGNPHVWGYLRAGSRKRLEYISLGCFEENYSALQKQVELEGVTLVDPPSYATGGGFWFRGVDELLVQIVVSDKTSPDHQVESPAITTGAMGRNAPFRNNIDTVHPRRLSHLLLFCSNVSRAIQFYSATIGLRLSDRSGDNIAFMHAAHGSDHHVLAFAKSNGLGLHHSSWNVDTIEDVGLGAMQMSAAGFGAGWGLGRHVLGSNYFHYVRDPWGSYAEYSAQMDFIAEDVEWGAGDHPAEESFFLWGPPPPSDFVENYELKIE